MSAMLFMQLKIAMVVLLLGIGGHYCVWTALGGHQEEQIDAGRSAANPFLAATQTPPQPQATPPVALYRLHGTVRIEETDEPIAGAKLLVRFGDFPDLERRIERLVESGADGQFSTQLPAGPFQIRPTQLPAGYRWVVSEPPRVQSNSLGPDEPAIQQDFQVREGTTWALQFTRGPERRPSSGFVSGDSGTRWEEIEAQADLKGAMHLTLPREEREVALLVQESSSSSAELDTGYFYVRLKWAANFRPDKVKRFGPSNQMPRGLQLIDANEKSAFLSALDRQIEPLIENGRLLIHVAMPDRGPQDYGGLTGQVVDDKDRPIAGRG